MPCCKDSGVERNKIHCMDCLEGLKTIDENSVDFVFTDPPYNIDLKYDKYKDKKSEKEFWKFINEVFAECYRILKTGSHLTFTCAQKQIWIYRPMLEEMGFVFRHLGIWHNPKRKAGGWPGQWPFAWEAIMDFSKVKFNKLNNGNSVGYMDVWIETEPKGIKHPAKRPVQCWEDILLLCSNEGDLVVDPFCGSGTTPLVCKKNNRDYLCYEISEDYVKMTEERIISG